MTRSGHPFYLTNIVQVYVAAFILCVIPVLDTGIQVIELARQRT